MRRREICFTPIGVIHSEHTVPEKTPIQPIYAQECFGTANIYAEYADGLKDLEGFSHVYLLYHMHRAKPTKLIVKPFLQDSEHGVFATRFPARPNTVGLSVAELIERRGNILHLKGVDILDETPLIDIKPYSAKFDHIQATRNGWMDEVSEAEAIQRGQREYKA